MVIHPSISDLAAAAAAAFLSGKSHRQRRLVGYSPWNHIESGTTEHTPTDYINLPKLLLLSSSMNI